ncbi:alpha/beta hydrolase [Streptomyces sp. DSM 41987]|uniref:alpha/beta hydrolase n=1 Tax=Streptomyces TaxID=1883 RepID=UPI0018DFE351|nr:alpha/beta hydrolase [Streptomyces fildesensis]
MGLVNNPRTVTATLAAAFVLAAGIPASASAPPAAVSHPPAAAPTTAAGLDRYEHQSLAWKSCVLGPDDDTGQELEKAGARCADVIVPLDYADHGGRTITVAVSRIKATDTAHRIGSLLLNTGGPGGQDIGDPPWVHDAMKDAGGRYDIVGMDPRFVGRSTPLDCGWPTGSPCAFWDRPRERPTVVRHDLPALMVNATGDPRTPYAGATAMHRAWPSSRLVTVDGADRHGIYGAYGNTCADNTVNVYLRTGRLPAADVTCPTTGPTAGTRPPRAGG